MNERPIRILTLNIQGDKHLPEVTRLLADQRPDVACLQEVFEQDFLHLRDELRMGGLFLPAIDVKSGGPPGYKERGLMGVAILGMLPGAYDAAYYFKRRQEKIPLYQGVANAGHRALVWQEIKGERKKEEGRRLVVATTHFTWSKGGKPSQKQRKELASLFRLLDRVKPDVFCGDFNAPRGGEIYDALSKRFVDNIPSSVRSTLDPKLHYSHGIELVVDGFFTSPAHRVSDIRLISGVSDHLAIVGTVVPNPNLE